MVRPLLPSFILLVERGLRSFFSSDACDLVALSSGIEPAFLQAAPISSICWLETMTRGQRFSPTLLSYFT